MPLHLFEDQGPFNHIYHNPSVGKLYQIAEQTRGNAISNTGALIAYSGAKTGRSPKDKRIVDEPTSVDDIWWGDINRPISENSFAINRQTAINYLQAQRDVFVIDGFAGWDPTYQIKVRVICTRPYHALFMRNMLIRPTADELADFGEPEWVIFNAGALRANTCVEGIDSHTSVDIDFNTREAVILGSEYAGEMKKGVFTVLNYLLPKQGVLSMHCSANEGSSGDTALFFGLSGTGKTTLSADPRRRLIGDDEHGWSDNGLFNFEGGCYAKTIHLAKEREPEIWEAIRFGALLENVVYDPDSFEVNYDDASVTQNTRVSYPIEFISNAKIPCVGGHPENIIFLTCDAFGVLPPVSRLSPEQAMYHFISGYTAKVAGTEMGIDEPEATFSACFGAAFMVWHPAVYAELLAERIRTHGVKVWLINTGWTGGAYGTGQRISLPHTRAIVDAVLGHQIDQVTYRTDPRFGVQVPCSVPGVPDEMLQPEATWSDKDAFADTANQLVRMFTKNFEVFAEGASDGILSAAPVERECAVSSV